MSQTSKKTSTITFRLDDDILKKLRAESNHRQVSTNTLVNQALRRFLEWDMYQPISGFVMINKRVFIHIFGKMKQEEIIDVASRIGKNEVKDIALFMKSKLDLETFLSWFEMRMINSSVQVSHTQQNGSHTYIMKHDIGKNWSLYHKTILDFMFQEVFDKKILIKADKNTISFEFSE